MSSGGTTYWNSGSIPLIAPDILGEIITAASDLALVVSPQGRVLSVLRNPESGQLVEAEEWDGQDIRDCLTPDSVQKAGGALDRMHNEGRSFGGVELNHTANSGAEFPLRYSFHRIGPDGTVLMLGRDLRPIAEMQEQLVKAQLALEQDYEIQRDFDTRYRVLMEVAIEPLLFVSIGTGKVTDANAAAAAVLGLSREDLSGATLAQEFDGKKRGEFVETLTNAALAEGAGPVTARLKRTGEEVQLTPTAFRAAGERMLLLRIEGEGGAAAPAGVLSEDLQSLFAGGVDGIVFTDGDGVIRAANESFLGLTDAAHASAVKGRSLAQFLSRGAVDLKVLLDNAERAGQMRMYATKLASAYGTHVPVEISVTHLADRAHPAFVFVLRDASRAEALRKPGLGVTDDAMRSVMELVGSATLKDIVAETTDVVEKLCIETAVELTRNNRVAAAEMLGLSRQSLYVKLRKYGLLARDD
ncbi:MAG: transcriptional regulator PpsR [Pseudomonadota bacterium]